MNEPILFVFNKVTGEMERYYPSKERHKPNPMYVDVVPEETCEQFNARMKPLLEHYDALKKISNLSSKPD